MAGVAFSVLFIVSQAYDLLPAINDIHFLHKAPLLMSACMIVHVIVSSMTTPPSEETVKSMTWNVGLFKAETEELKDLPWYENYRYLAIILLIITAIVVGHFLVIKN